MIWQAKFYVKLGNWIFIAPCDLGYSFQVMFNNIRMKTCWMESWKLNWKFNVTIRDIIGFTI